MDRLLRLKSVLDLTVPSRSRVYELVAVGAFPAPVKIGTRAVAWRASEIAAWIDSRPSTASRYAASKTLPSAAKGGERHG